MNNKKNLKMKPVGSEYMEQDVVPLLGYALGN